MDAELRDCKNQIERQILVLEGKTLQEITAIKRDIVYINKALSLLVSRPEFHPVQMIAYGLAGGVGISALGAIMSKILGW